MPYIAAKDRPQYDAAIATIAKTLAALPDDARKGHANYVITQIMRKAWGVDDPDGGRYSKFADMIGTFECAKLELYRRWVGPYEDGAIERNGDV